MVSRERAIMAIEVFVKGMYDAGCSSSMDWPASL
jgi:hypothetical protein